MSQINENYEQKIAKYKAFIMELVVVQELYFQKLLEEINATPKVEEFLFDYIYDENFSTFKDYLLQFPQGRDMYELRANYEWFCPK